MLKTKIRKNLAKLILSATMVTTVAGGTVTALAAGATSSDYVNFRTGPGMDHSVQFVVKPGTTVNIVSEMGYWSKVEVSGKPATWRLSIWSKTLPLKLQTLQ